VRGWNVQHVVLVPRLPGSEGFVETGPVPFSQALGDDEIEGAAERLGRSKSEKTLGGGVPEPDYTVTVADDDGIAECLDHLLVAD
jgi:hypothetical protein